MSLECVHCRKELHKDFILPLWLTVETMCCWMHTATPHVASASPGGQLTTPGLGD